MASRYPPALRMPSEVQGLIGSSNRLFPDLHGTPAEMQTFWDGFESELREMWPEAMERYESPGIHIAKRVVPTSWDTDKELTVWCCVEMHETEDGVEKLDVVVQTSGLQVPCTLYKCWSTKLDDPDKHQTFKQSLAAAAKFMADYRPCKGPHTWNIDARCGRHCIDGQDYCLTHWVGVPFQAAVDGRVAKRQRTQ